MRLLESSTLMVPLPEGSVVKKSATLIAGSPKNWSAPSPSSATMARTMAATDCLAMRPYSLSSAAAFSLANCRMALRSFVSHKSRFSSSASLYTTERMSACVLFSPRIPASSCGLISETVVRSGMPRLP